MAAIVDEEILGYFIPDHFLTEACVCRDCVTDDEEEKITQDRLIIEVNIGKEYKYFCDRCEKEIC